MRVVKICPPVNKPKPKTIRSRGGLNKQGVLQYHILHSRLPVIQYTQPCARLSLIRAVARTTKVTWKK